MFWTSCELTALAREIERRAAGRLDALFPCTHPKCNAACEACGGAGEITPRKVVRMLRRVSVKVYHENACGLLEPSPRALEELLRAHEPSPE